MLKTIEQYTVTDGGSVEIIQTAHSGPNYHVRYGLQVKAFSTLAKAQKDFEQCLRHARECAGLCAQ